MKNFLQHKLQIIQDFCNSYKLSSFKDIWGIALNCNTMPQELAWLNKELLDYQTLSDCCELCAGSKQPSGVILSQLATLSTNPTFPFIQVPNCSTQEVCSYTNAGDFNLSDFNTDFYI